ncbi:hypothetical protein JCM17960_29220 [Magnetospira thiophila]
MTRRADRLLALGLTLLTVALFSATQPALWNLPDSPPVAEPEAIAAFLDRVAAQEAAYRVGQTDDGTAIVQPPPGDVYLRAERFRFVPSLELRQGQTYRLHVASVDLVHGLTLPEQGITALLIPGHPVTVTLTPGPGKRLPVRCSEYCGLEHSRMEAWIKILPPEDK